MARPAEKKELNPKVAAIIIAVAVLLVFLVGYHLMNRPSVTGQADPSLSAQYTGIVRTGNKGAIQQFESEHPEFKGKSGKYIPAAK